ncbi:uncharacterized protein LOC142360193 [Opisthocomus hoazin]|uniref:uncharacterized protein LOC142360193 n=1 Tax=Opisthocomus hoazin TaxID=30419 RepID=UPI003F52BFE8
MSKSPGSTESESCVACTLLLIFGSLCRAARLSGRRRTDCSPLDQRAQLQEGVPRCRRGRGSVGGPDPGAERLPGLAGWGTAKRPELRKRNGGEQDGEASEAAESPGSAESESCGAGEPNDWSCGRRGEERRGEKHLKCQSLPAAPRVRAAWPAPCSSFLAASAEQRVSPGGDGRTVRRWINGRSCRKECRGVGGAEGASGAPTPEQSGSRDWLGGGQPSDRSYGRGMEESRTEKRLKRQSLPGARRARAAVGDSQATGVTEEEWRRAGRRSV